MDADEHTEANFLKESINSIVWFSGVNFINDNVLSKGWTLLNPLTTERM